MTPVRPIKRVDKYFKIHYSHIVNQYYIDAEERQRKNIFVFFIYYYDQSCSCVLLVDFVMETRVISSILYSLLF